MLVNRKLANDAVGIQLLIRTTFSVEEQQGIVDVQAAIESCTGAANLADELINTAGWNVTLAHPGIVSRMKQNPDKSDHTDAFVLANLKRIGYLPKVWLAPEEIRQLRSLVRHRAQLVKQRTRIKLRIRALLREHRVSSPMGVRPWTQVWLAWLMRVPFNAASAFLREEYLEEIQRLNNKILRLEKKLIAQTADDALVKRLLQMEGIGPITAITMRAEIACFDRFDSGKQLSRYCGVTPRNASSGQKAGGCRSRESRESRFAGGADPGRSETDVVQFPLEYFCHATQTKCKAA